MHSVKCQNQSTFQGHELSSAGPCVSMEEYLDRSGLKRKNVKAVSLGVPIQLQKHVQLLLIDLPRNVERRRVVDRDKCVRWHAFSNRQCPTMFTRITALRRGRLRM